MTNQKANCSLKIWIFSKNVILKKWNYDENAIAFFARFVARRNIAKSNCDHCRNDMMKTPMDESAANEKYIEFREYLNEDEDAPTVTKLVRPTTLFTNITKTQLMAFNCTWKYRGNITGHPHRFLKRL